VSIRASAPKTVLLAHNYYQHPGGEDVQFRADIAMLERHGHTIVRYERTNDEIARYGLRRKGQLALDTTWSVRSSREVRALLATSPRPMVAHFYNTFPLISLSAPSACHRAGVPVVLSLANYRLTCSNSYLYRDGRVCEDCLHRKVKWPAVVHRCYRDSVLESAVAASMLTAHTLLRNWARQVDVFLAMSNAVRDTMIEAGLPADSVYVRHNVVEPDPGVRADGPDGGFALFVGRLSPEKDVATLIDAAASVPGLPVKIAGDGPDRPALEQRTRDAGVRHVEFLGHRSRDEVLALMKTARVLVVPSAWYEPFGYVVAEALACGLPVFASDLGALPELIDSTVGRTFRAGDSKMLASLLRWASDHPDQVALLRDAARARYEAMFTDEVGYSQLVELYELGAQRFAARRRAAGS
jgi:glycosyltransferase involved in cell wall biosynthesis